jgi:hypothetical protein
MGVNILDLSNIYKGSDFQTLCLMRRSNDCFSGGEGG